MGRRPSPRETSGKGGVLGVLGSEKKKEKEKESAKGIWDGEGK